MLVPSLCGAWVTGGRERWDGELSSSAQHTVAWDKAGKTAKNGIKKKRKHRRAKRDDRPETLFPN